MFARLASTGNNYNNSLSHLMSTFGRQRLITISRRSCEFRPRDKGRICLRSQSWSPEEKPSEARVYRWPESHLDTIHERNGTFILGLCTPSVRRASRTWAFTADPPVCLPPAHPTVDAALGIQCPPPLCPWLPCLAGCLGNGGVWP